MKLSELRKAWPWLAASAFVLVVWLGFLAPRIWAECRADHHTVLYCMRMVSR